MLRDFFSLFPAYAGVIPWHCLSVARLAAFPRICGGDPMGAQQKYNRNSLFPAYAGVILSNLGTWLNPASFPRICGGDPCPAFMVNFTSCFSPHMRG